MNVSVYEDIAVESWRKGKRICLKAHLPGGGAITAEVDDDIDDKGILEVIALPELIQHLRGRGASEPHIDQVRRLPAIVKSTVEFERGPRSDTRRDT